MATIDLDSLAGQVGTQVLDRLKVQLGSAWGDLSAEAVGGITRAALTMGRVKLMAAAGNDVSQDMKDVEAQLANWAWTGASIVKRNFWLATLHVLSVGAQAVGIVLGSLASAALARLGMPLGAAAPVPPAFPGPAAPPTTS